MGDRLNQFHKEFVDLMFPYFGLKKNPGYAEVKTKKLLSYGGFTIIDGNPEIWLNNILNLEETRFTMFHESGHHLHLRNREWTVRYNREIPEEEYRLGEIVANLGTFVFLQKSNRKEEIQKYLECQKDIEEIAIAYNLFIKRENVLNRIANMEVEDAERIINQN